MEEVEGEKIKSKKERKTLAELKGGTDGWIDREDEPECRVVKGLKGKKTRRDVF